MTFSDKYEVENLIVKYEALVALGELKQQLGKDATEDFDEAEKYLKQSTLHLIQIGRAEELKLLLEAEIIKPEYNNMVVGKYNELKEITNV